MRLPRQGTRVRALFDELYDATQAAGGSLWRPLKDAYDNADPAYNYKLHGPRRYSSMTITKLLRKYATKRGNPGSQFYTMKPEWVELVEGRTEAGAKVIGSLMEAVNAQNCGKAECSQCTECECKELGEPPFKPGQLVRGNKGCFYNHSFYDNEIYEIDRCEWSNRDEKWYVFLRKTHDLRSRDIGLGGWDPERFVAANGIDGHEPGCGGAPGYKGLCKPSCPKFNKPLWTYERPVCLSCEAYKHNITELTADVARLKKEIQQRAFNPGGLGAQLEAEKRVYDKYIQQARKALFDLEKDLDEARKQSSISRPLL